MKNFKLFILFIITAAFLVPGVIRAANCPTLTFESTNITNNTVDIALHIEPGYNTLIWRNLWVNWGDEGTKSIESCGCKGTARVTKTFSHPYQDSKTFTIHAWIVVIDPNEGVVNCDSIEKTITLGGNGGGDEPPELQDVSISSNKINEGDSVTLSGSVSDDCATGTLLQVYIQWGDVYGGVKQEDTKNFTCKTGTPIEDEAFTGLPFTHTYRTAGNYQLNVYALDSSPDTDDDLWTTSIGVGFEEEEIQIEPKVDPFVHEVGEEVPVTIEANVSGKYEDITTIFLSCPYSGSEQNEDCAGTQRTCTKKFNRTFTKDGEHLCQTWVKVKTSLGFEESRKFSFFVRVNPKGGTDGDDGDDGDDGEGIHTPIGTIEITNLLTATDFKDFIDKIVSFLFTISLVIVPILLVAAGIMFLTAQGDPTKVGTAKKMVLYTLIGFAIISLARVFVKLIYQVFLE